MRNESDKDKFAGSANATGQERLELLTTLRSKSQYIMVDSQTSTPDHSTNQLKETQTILARTVQQRFIVLPKITSIQEFAAANPFGFPAEKRKKKSLRNRSRELRQKDYRPSVEQVPAMGKQVFNKLFFKLPFSLEKHETLGSLLITTENCGDDLDHQSLVGKIFELSLIPFLVRVIGGSGFSVERRYGFQKPFTERGRVIFSIVKGDTS